MEFLRQLRGHILDFAAGNGFAKRFKHHARVKLRLRLVDAFAKRDPLEKFGRRVSHASVMLNLEDVYVETTIAVEHARSLESV